MGMLPLEVRLRTALIFRQDAPLRYCTGRAACRSALPRERFSPLTRNRRSNLSQPIAGSYSEGYLYPAQYGPAVQEIHDDRLDRRRSIVREYDCRNNHVAAVVEDD
jgi:hypothetical protein